MKTFHVVFVLMIFKRSESLKFNINLNDYDDEVSEGPGFGGAPLLVDTSGAGLKPPIVVHHPQPFGFPSQAHGPWGYFNGGLVIFRSILCL